MFILEKFNGWDEIDVGQSYYYDVTFKDVFWKNFKKHWHNKMKQSICLIKQ